MSSQTIPQHFGFSARIFAAAKASLAHECHFAAQEPISQLRNAAKRRVSKSERAILADCSSLLSLTAQASGHLLRSTGQISATRNGANQRGKSSSPSSRKKAAKGASSRSLSEPSQPSNSSSGEARAAKASGERYLTRSGGRPLQKRPRVESSEPIDLTEQSPEPSHLRFLSSSSPFHLRCHLRRRKQTSGASSTTSRAPNSI
ncbi:hypothetical protein CK203_082161 [Vitis vinifera]|uniref:Uncharacterized protein n=1 Tax=Vitis vinifera TaxID=29760 RepID=A0A438CMR4_VITVI|nr:hypothetical protein CK203_082161 [Vitis vinifera]